MKRHGRVTSSVTGRVIANGVVRERDVHPRDRWTTGCGLAAPATDWLARWQTIAAGGARNEPGSIISPAEAS